MKGKLIIMTGLLHHTQENRQSQAGLGVIQEYRGFHLRIAGFIMILLLLSTMSAMAQISISVTGFPVFDTSSLMITEAGLDFNSSISESSPNTYVNIRHTTNNFDYVVQVSLAEQVGQSSLWVKRAGAGTKPGGGGGAGQLTGGQDFMMISTQQQTFFQGKQERVNIPVQFDLQNISVTNPAGTLVYSVLFTVVQQ